jgi:hypothetical protein
VSALHHGLCCQAMGLHHALTPAASGASKFVVWDNNYVL